MPSTAQVRRPSGGSAVHPEERKTKTVSSPDKLTSSVMASTFRIPKRKSSEDRCTQMASPLSRLQDTHEQKMQWTGGGRRGHECRPVNGNISSNGSRMASGSGNARSMDARLVLTDILKTELGREYLSGGRSRPKRASDTLCQDLRRDDGSWRTSAGGRGPVQSESSGGGGLDRRRPLIKDTTLPLSRGGGGPEEAVFEGLRCARPPSRNEDCTTVQNKEERRKDALVRRNGEGSENGELESDDEERGIMGPSRRSVLHHSDKSVRQGGTPKRRFADLQGRPPSTGSTSGSDPQTPPRQGDRDKRTPPKLSPSNRPKKPKLGTLEPIVLSSDDGEDEEGDSTSESSPTLPQVRVVAPRIETQSELHPEETTNAQAIAEELVIPGLSLVEEPEEEPSDMPSDMPSFIELAFSALYVGSLRAESNGSISITNDSITIPLRDSSGLPEVAVALVTSELRRYGIWDGGVLEGKEGRTPSLLFLWVSDAQARLVQAELSAIHPVHNPGLASPFLLLCLKENLEGLHGVLLNSFMEVLALQCGVPALMQPFTWSEGVALIRRVGHHAHLLSLLGQEAAEPDQNPQEDSDPHPGPAQQESPGRSKPSYTLRHRRVGSTYSVSIAPRPGPAWSRSKHQGPPRRLILFPPPPTKGGISVTTEDLECLDNGEFLNDVIIDFYLKYLMLEKAPKAVAERSHVFSSFFYRQLTRKDNVSEETSVCSAQQRRHQRVRTWTRHVDIFSKDYLFVPVNQEAHWYLVVICFPGLLEPQTERWSRENCLDKESCGREDRRMTGHSVPECTQLGCKREKVCKRPCILVMNSLKLSYHERVLKLLREYLQVEWEVRRSSPRDFTPEQMKGSQCRVPLQDNSSDCGLYLLQYVESFLQNPVVHFELPVQLDHWFPRRQIRSKRDEIREMVLQLHRKQQGCGR
ncbi:sentrin-specific protease 7b isoform X1 [Anguilla anguilla]|uniref:sentrin-specific protease 7b isoform X1 n=1 Tax=Anguilla anguilla TaxID=7936 RepID=UPI0015B34C5E|nr:sentrin-specific protease 7b isoform X1 [Anguilla anguilla]